MASSGSGQIPINCQFCETEKVIKWKCVDCELLICDKCKDKIHWKIKGGKDHKILDIKEIGFQTEELNFANLKCQDHSGQNYCLYCKTCESLVCPVCIAKIHKKQHDLVEITEEYNFRIDRLKKGQRKILNDKSEKETDQVHLKQIQTTGHANYVKVKENILIQEKALINTVRNYAGRLTEELKKHLTIMTASTDGDINSISIGITKIDEKYKDLENLISMTDIAEFFREVDRIEKSMNHPPPKTTASLCLSLPKFVEGEITQFNFGTLVHEKNFESNQNVTITIDTEYNTGLTIVGTLIACPDDSLWITNSYDGVLKKVKPEGTYLNELALYNIKVSAMAIIKSDDLLLKVFKKNRLQYANSTTGHLSDSVYDAKPFITTAIHATSDNKVLVGGFKGKIGVVIVMNDKGHHERVYERDQHEQPIATYPKGITSTRIGNIHVVDCDPDNDKGRIVVLGQNGDITNKYSGHSEVNNVHKFKPVAIAITPRDNIIVVDTDILHILNNTGLLMTYFNTKGIGIIHPKSLTFTHSGQVYIGCSQEKSSIKEAKLYKVNISGC